MNKSQWRIRQWLSRLHPEMRQGLCSRAVEAHDGEIPGDIFFGVDRFSPGPLVVETESCVFGFKGDFDKFVRWASLWYFRYMEASIAEDLHHRDFSEIFGREYLLDYPPFVEWYLGD